MDIHTSKIKTHMQVISADGRRVGYVERMTDSVIITHFPCRHIAFGSIRRVTDDVYIAERYEQLREFRLLAGPGSGTGDQGGDGQDPETPSRERRVSLPQTKH